VVLGLEFLEKYNPRLFWKQRMIHIRDPVPKVDNVYVIQAKKTHALPHIDSNCIELCTMQEFADLVSRVDCDGAEIFLGFVRCTASDSFVSIDEHLYAGRGAQDPRVAEIIS
jgi:hypothetical protein